MRRLGATGVCKIRSESRSSPSTSSEVDSRLQPHLYASDIGIGGVSRKGYPVLGMGDHLGTAGVVGFLLFPSPSS